MIVIIAALKAEIVPLINILGINEKIPLGCGTLYRGKEISLIRTGIGEEKAVKVIQIYLNNSPCDFLLNIGFAGALDGRLNMGDCYFISEVMSSELNSPAILMSAYPESSLKEKRLITVNEPVMNSKKREELKDRFEASLVDMEGYALAALCKQKNIPFASIKIVSDQADELTKEEINLNHRALAGKLVISVLNYLEQLNVSI